MRAQFSDISRLFSEKLLWFAEKDSAAGVMRDSEKQKGLIAALQICEEKPACGGKTAQAAGFGVAEIDEALDAGGLRFGAIHELFFDAPRESYLPLIVPVCLSAGSFYEASGRYFFWIGKKVWPSPFILEQAGGAEFLSRCVFLDPPDEKSLLWSVETALRSRAVSCVTAAVKNLKFSSSRRLELAAGNGATLGMLLRSARDLKDNSAAATRWRIKHKNSSGLDPLFELELLKQKGSGARSLRWMVRFHTDEDGRKKISLHIPSGLGGRSETEALRGEALRKCAG